MDVHCVVTLERLFAGLLPPTAGQRDTERAGVSMGHPGPLCAVPDGIFHRSVRPGTLDQTTHPALQQRRALLCGIYHLGRFTIIGGRRRFRRWHIDVGRLGHGVIHLAGQLGAPLSVLLHQSLRVCNQRISIPGSMFCDVVGHLPPGFLIQTGQPVDVLDPAFLRYLHLLPQAAPAGRAHAVPAL